MALSDQGSLFASADLISYITLLGLLYLGSAILYRLYFSPLAKFPGPKLAGIHATFLPFFLRPIETDFL